MCAAIVFATRGRVPGAETGTCSPRRIASKRETERHGAVIRMDEEYTVVSPFVLWRRRLLIAVIIIPLLALAWRVGVLYDNSRVNSGPNAWFMVGTRVTGYRYRPASPEYVLGDGYATERDCSDALNRMPRPYSGPLMSCRRLLLSDAAQMLMH